MGTSTSVLSTVDQPTLEFQNQTKEEKRNAILEKIMQEPIIVELKILLYIAACESMTEKSGIVPSPKAYLDKPAEKEVLQEINRCIPNLFLLKDSLLNPDLYRIPDEVLAILHWLLIGLKEPRLFAIGNQSDWPNLGIGDDYAVADDVRKPDLMIKVGYSTMSARYLQWKAKTYGMKILYGFMPVQLQDVHSALFCGMRRLVNKMGIGRGVTISSSLLSCYHKKKPAWTWGKSCIGLQISACLMIEYAENDETILKIASRQPVDYFISDSSYTRIRYILVWVHVKPETKAPVLRNILGMDYYTGYTPIITTFILVAALTMIKRTIKKQK